MAKALKTLIVALAGGLASLAQAGPLLIAIDPAAGPAPAPKAGEAIVIVRFWAGRMAGDNRVDFHRWDAAAGKPLVGTDGKPDGFRTTFSQTLFAGKKGERVARILVVPAGDYVMASRTFNIQLTDSFCFGAPRFTLAPGSVTYLGDFEMTSLLKTPDREMRNGLRYTPDLEGARTALAALYPAQAAALTPWQPINGTRLPCIGDEFLAYAVPGAEGPATAALEPAAAAARSGIER